MEIDSLKKISKCWHPNVLQMVGCVTLTDPMCLVTEYLENGDLHTYMRLLKAKVCSKPPKLHCFICVSFTSSC